MVELGPQFGIALHHDTDGTVVEVAGELDLSTAPILRRALCSAVQDGERRLVVDLCRLEFIDLSGLAVLEDIARELIGVFGRLVLRHPTRRTCRLLALRAEWDQEELWELDP